jgi:hypothetical protein
MTRKQAVKELKKLQAKSEDDAESAHVDADDVLCKLLTTLGYGDVVEEFNKVDRWYS